MALNIINPLHRAFLIEWMREKSEQLHHLSRQDLILEEKLMQSTIHNCDDPLRIIAITMGDFYVADRNLIKYILRALLIITRLIIDTIDAADTLAQFEELSVRTCD